MMVRLRTSLAAAAAIGLIAGCGGGGSAPSATQAPTDSGGSPMTPTGKARATLTVVIGPKKGSKTSNARHAALAGRKREYVSPSTSGLIAEFVGSDSSSDVVYQGYALQPSATETSSSPASCGAAAEDGSFTCTLFFELAPNITYTATLTAYDAAQSGTTGQPVSQSSALSTQTQTGIAISANMPNTFSFTLSGIVEGFRISPQYVGVAGTSEGTGTLTSVFQALDADDNAIDAYDTATGYSYGSQPSGPFSSASFPVVASDENEPCDAAAKAPTKRKRMQEDEPCLTTTSTAVTDPASETVSYTYDGGGSGGDGTTNNPPYYGEITLTPPTNYGGSLSNGNAASLYIVPFFGFVDQTSAYENGSASVVFTSPNQSITGFGAQFHPPSAAPGDGSGYTVDASSCDSDGGPIASVGSPTYTAGLGISFTITAGSATGGCTLTLSDDGTATGADTATINISNTASEGAVTVPSPGPVYSPNARQR